MTTSFIGILFKMCEFVFVFNMAAMIAWGALIFLTQFRPHDKTLHPKVMHSKYMYMYA